MKYAAIVGNGLFDDTFTEFVREADTVICADGGANHLVERGILPDYIIGDMDSIDPVVLKKIEKILGEDRMISYPTDKDYTDMELAIEFAIGEGYENIKLIGATGERLDHTICNITSGFKYENANIEIIDKHNIISVIGAETRRFQNKKGENISVIPLSKEFVFTVTGMKFPAENLCTGIGNARGIDNIIMSDNASISVKKGYGLIMFSEDRSA